MLLVVAVELFAPRALFSAEEVTGANDWRRFATADVVVVVVVALSCLAAAVDERVVGLLTAEADQQTNIQTDISMHIESE